MNESYAILKYVKKYNTSEVYLFGSSNGREDVNDIDIGMKRILIKSLGGGL
jgi:hypothetical protein